MNLPLATVLAAAALLMPAPSDASPTWKESTLISFNGNDGDLPYAGVLFDLKGNLYGTTVGGGTNGVGALFQLAPPASPGGSWRESVLVSFTGENGIEPEAGLIFDKKGNLYGTAEGGFGGDASCGDFGCGVAFKLAPPAAGQTAWTETVLHHFDYADGDNPSFAGLVLNKAGDLFGTTYYGGNGVGKCLHIGCGTVYELSPPATASGNWTEKLLASFSGPKGQFPTAGLVFDAKGNLYGTTTFGGSRGSGNVFELSPPTGGETGWQKTMIHAFNGNDGRSPNAGVVFDRLGNLYGTTYIGGVSNDGVVFKLAPPAAKKTAWQETVLATFSGANGAYPYAGLARDEKGNVYGTTVGGGNTAACPADKTDNLPAGCGVVFELTPPAAGKTAWTQTILLSFNGKNGSHPFGSLIFDAAGNLYGTTGAGGKFGHGTVFELSRQ